VTDKPLLQTLSGHKQKRPPIWFMRQAGRYLPEYRELRAKAPDFLSLCYTPSLAAEITLQPVRRFDLDAAILFSDILVIPDALGQKVRFAEGEGPLLEGLDVEAIGRLDPETVMARLSPVLETVSLVRARLEAEKTLLGFCGAPWTVATYMIGGRGSSDQAAAKQFALREPKAFSRLMDVLVEASTDYLVAQIRAGADAVQVFESWAQNLDDELFDEFVIVPNRRIVESVRQRLPGAVMIGFPRGAGHNLEGFARLTGFNAIGLDYTVPLDYAATTFEKTLPVQGNLEPQRLVAGGAQLDRRIDAILAAFSDRPHVFNLGHGIVPETPIAHVEQMIARVRRS
jgi:uroporphyrinogen decarboxylase